MILAMRDAWDAPISAVRVLPEPLSTSDRPLDVGDRVPKSRSVARRSPEPVGRRGARGTRVQRYLGRLKAGDVFELNHKTGIVEEPVAELIGVNIEGGHDVLPPFVVVEVIR